MSGGSALSTGAGLLDADAANGLSATSLPAPAPTKVGLPVTLIAMVTGLGGSPPAGTVTFTEGVTTLGSVPLDGSGQAQLTTSSLSVGNHPITATYSGDATDDASASTATTVAIIDLPTAPESVKATAIAGGKIRVDWSPPTTLNNSAITSYTVTRSDIPASPFTVPAPATSFVNTGLTNNTTYTYQVTATNGAGPGPASSQVSATADNTVPVVTLTAPATLFGLSRSIAVRYSATDTGSDVATYDIRYRSARWNGRFSAYTTKWSKVAVTTETFAGSLGYEYCFGVRARDHAGNLTAWTADKCAVVPLDDRSLTATTAGWVRGTSTSTYLKTLTKTTTLGAKLQINGARTHLLAIVVTACPSCGNVSIYLGSTLWRTVSTTAATTRYKVIIVPPSFSFRTTNITLKNASRKLLVIDGLGIANT